MACPHRFQGDKDGVCCLLCGLRMTPKEYVEYQDQGATEKANSAARKPRADRKKKEGPADE